MSDKGRSKLPQEILIGVKPNESAAAPVMFITEEEALVWYKKSRDGGYAAEIYRVLVDTERVTKCYVRPAALIYGDEQ